MGAETPRVLTGLQKGTRTRGVNLPLALRDLEQSTDPVLVQSALGLIAMARGLKRTAEILLDFTEGELEELVDKYRGATS